MARRTHPTGLFQCCSTSPPHLWALQLWPCGPQLSLAPLTPLPASCNMRRDMAISAAGMVSSEYFATHTQSTSLFWGFMLELWSFYLLAECFMTVLQWFLRCCWNTQYNGWICLSRCGEQENRFCVWPVHLHKTALKGCSLLRKPDSFC